MTDVYSTWYTQCNRSSTPLPVLLRFTFFMLRDNNIAVTRMYQVVDCDYCYCCLLRTRLPSKANVALLLNYDDCYSPCFFWTASTTTVRLRTTAFGRRQQQQIVQEVIVSGLVSGTFPVTLDTGLCRCFKRKDFWLSYPRYFSRCQVTEIGLWSLPPLWTPCRVL